MSAENIAGLPIKIMEQCAKDKIYMMPPDIIELIEMAERGEITWEFVADEAAHAVKEGRISILTDIA